MMFQDFICYSSMSSVCISGRPSNPVILFITIEAYETVLSFFCASLSFSDSEFEEDLMVSFPPIPAGSR